MSKWSQCTSALCRPPGDDSWGWKETSGPIEIYEKMFYWPDLCKHLAAEFMGSLILGPTEIYFVNLAHAMINRLFVVVLFFSSGFTFRPVPPRHICLFFVTKITMTETHLGVLKQDFSNCVRLLYHLWAFPHLSNLALCSVRGLLLSLTRS